MTRRSMCAALAAATVIAASPALLAHMKLVRSLPAADSTVASPPATIQVWFTQMPDVKVSRLGLEGPSGAVTLGTVRAAQDKSIAAAVEGATPDGAYTVSWQAAGDDGHIQRGTFRFTLRRSGSR